MRSKYASEKLASRISDSKFQISILNEVDKYDSFSSDELFFLLFIGAVYLSVRSSVMQARESRSHMRYLLIPTTYEQVSEFLRGFGGYSRCIGKSPVSHRQLKHPLKHFTTHL